MHQLERLPELLLRLAEDGLKGLQAGFFRYLSKPIKIDGLVEALDVALALAEARSALVAHDRGVTGKI